MLKKLLKNERGLTLVELLAVIVIMGIVGTIGVVSIGNVIQNSREDAVKADAIQILNAANLYVAQNGITGTGGAASGTMTIELKELDVNGAAAFRATGANTTVTATPDEVRISTTEGIVAGTRKIIFNNATVQNINDAGRDGSPGEETNRPVIVQ